MGTLRMLASIIVLLIDVLARAVHRRRDAYLVALSDERAYRRAWKQSRRRRHG